MFQKLNDWERRLGLGRIRKFTAYFAVIAIALIALMQSHALDHSTGYPKLFYVLLWVACVVSMTFFVFRRGVVPLAISLAALFACSSAQARDYRLMSEEQSTNKQPEAVGIVICGICVLVIGGVVIYELCKIKIPPVNPPETNDVPPIVPPPFTNNMPTNGPATNKPAKPPHTWWKPWADTRPFSNALPIAAVAYWSLPGTFMDTNGAFPAPFTAYMTMPLASVQASVDLTNWSSQTVEVWASDAGFITVLHGFDGAPIATNYQALVNGEPQLPPVMPDPGIWSGDKPMEFYRPH